jgi:hypothetical protein
LTLASTLTGCNDNDDDSGSNNGGTTPVDPNKKPEKLTFTPVAKNLNDIVTVPEGYEANVLYALGDSINPALVIGTITIFHLVQASSFVLVTAMMVCIILV